MTSIKLPEPGPEPTPQVEWGRKLNEILKEHWVHTVRERRWARDEVVREGFRTEATHVRPRDDLGPFAVDSDLSPYGLGQWLALAWGEHQSALAAMRQAALLRGVGAPVSEDGPSDRNPDDRPDEPEEPDSE